MRWCQNPPSKHEDLVCVCFPISLLSLCARSGIQQIMDKCKSRLADSPNLLPSNFDGIWVFHCCTYPRSTVPQLVVFHALLLGMSPFPPPIGTVELRYMYTVHAES